MRKTQKTKFKTQNLINPTRIDKIYLLIMRISAGILLYRRKNNQLEVFLAHPGGPFFKNKDNGSWSIPKGENGDEGNDLFQTALRETKEETGIDLTDKSETDFIELGFVVYKSYKKVYAWAIELDLPKDFELKSNYFEIELPRPSKAGGEGGPPKSGKKYQFPEIDRGEFFPAEIAKQKIHPAQKEFIVRLEKMVTNNTRYSIS
jgi:predicted NUDIX family NTP pyrophosphohydrolase